MSRQRLYTIAALLLVIAGVIVWRSPETLLGTPPAQSDAALVLPTAVATGAATRHYTDSGALEYLFQADRLEYFAATSEDAELEGAYTVFDKPNLHFFQQERTWVIEARHGKLVEDDQRLSLWESVNIREQQAQADDPQAAIVLATSQLDIFPQQKYAQTQAPVKITSASGELTAVGMEANFAEKKITLLSEVRGIHDPL